VLYRQILAAQPDHADALHLLGVLALGGGHYDVAEDLIGQAIAVAPRNPIYRSNLGNALRQRGQLDEAIASYQQALALKPDYAEALTNLGVAWKEKGRLDDAIGCYQRALALRPSYPDAHNNLGNALTDRGRLDEAVDCFQQALTLQPENAGTYYNMATARLKQGRLEEALACYQRALTLRPAFADAWYNQGNTLQKLGRRQEAIACYQRAVALRPDFAEAHYNMALEWLVLGQYREAWPHYEWRWRCKDFHSPAREFPRPQWDGGPLAGRTVHLHAEQGLGDSIHFIRYVALVAQKGGRINLECQPQLKRLFQRIPNVCQVVTTGELLPEFDVHCPLQTLPLLLGTTLESIPREIPYLYAEAAASADWAQRLRGAACRLKVGLVWGGNTRNINDHNRSIPLAALGPLAQVPGVVFVSLQTGDPAEQAKNPPAGMPLLDWTQELQDFADTAALIANLDLVIAVDTAVAHLAGAMGKPVWVLLPVAPDWRWLLAREDSVWYPTMRLFRQAKAGEWGDVVARMGAALGQWMVADRAIG